MLPTFSVTEPRVRPLLVHPLCGSRLSVLYRTLAENGGVAPAHWHRLALMLASCLIREPFCCLEDLRFRSHRSVLCDGPPPVFIVGHWRSGTTLLHNLMSRDQRFAFPRQVEAFGPFDFFPSPTTRLQRALITALLPETRPMDDMRMGPDLPQEEEIALAAMGALSFFNCFYFPKEIQRVFDRAVMFEGCTTKEIERWQSSFRFFLEKLATLRRDRQLLLKNPANSARIATIRRMFPGAKFVHIMRHPMMVFTSTCKLYREMLPRVALQHYDLNNVGSLVLETYPRLMDRLLGDWKSLPAKSCVTIRYEELVSAPLDVMALIYEKVGLSGFGSAHNQMAQYLREHPIRASGTQLPDQETERSIREHWKHQFEALGYDPKSLKFSESD